MRIEREAEAMIVLIALVVLIAVLALFVLLTYNRLVALRLTSENAWAQVEVALKQRHDLVPALVEAVRGYARHERETFTGVADSRAGAVDAVGAGPGAQAPPEGLLALGLGAVLGVAEDYPELEASSNFSRLQSDLSAVEERISITRRVYNDTVERYNTAIAVFPPFLVARAFRFGPREFFSAEVEVHGTPKVELTGGIG